MSRDGANVAAIETRTGSADETEALGRRLGERTAPGDLIALIGPLGAGKTQLVRGIALGAGTGDARDISSPTFVLLNQYAAPRFAIHHLDAYRLEHPRELAALGFEELCESGGLVLVEWADRVRVLIPDSAAWIRLTPTGATERQVRLEGAAEIVQRFAPAFA